MKYKGKKLEGRNTDVLVLMRGQDRIVFKAEALDNYDEFDKLCSMPEPPKRLRPGGIQEANTSDPLYKKALDQYAENKVNYTIVRSLAVSEDIVWDNVHLDKVETWGNWRKELEEAGFTDIELMRVLQLCTRVNCLDEDLLDQAKEDFLAEAHRQEE